MTTNNIEARVKKIVVEQLGVKEDEFDCEIKDEEAEKITTIQEAIDFIKAKQK